MKRYFYLILLPLVIVVCLFSSYFQKLNAQATETTIYIPLTWERSKQADTISGGVVGGAVEEGLTLPTYPTSVWDNGAFTPTVNRNAVPDNFQWASWPHTYAVDIRHLKATFTFPQELDPATTIGTIFDPYYDSDIIPINDNIYVYLNGVHQFTGGVRYGAVNGGKNGTSLVANETDGWYVNSGVEITGFQSGINVLDIVVEEKALWGGVGYLALRLGSRSISPDGYLVSPTDDTTIGPSTILINANAWDKSGTGLKQVEFYVFYDGTWHGAGIDDSTSGPYQTIWQTPSQLNSQILKFGIHVIDNGENKAMFPGGIRLVNFIASLDNSVVENWVPFRAYLNQRSLSPDGDEKCSAASMAMILAMNSIISSRYDVMKDKANEIYPKVLNSDGDAYVGYMTTELIAQGMDAATGEYSTNDAWSTIKQEIDLGYPVIVRTAHGVVTQNGHFFVAVGYLELTNSHQVIVYDPFGEWRGTCCTGNYDINTPDPESRKGQWVYYDFDTAFGNSNWLITARPQSELKILAGTSEIPTTPPDYVSDEPETIGTYQGVEIEAGYRVYLPLTMN